MGSKEIRRRSLAGTFRGEENDKVTRDFMEKSGWDLLGFGEQAVSYVM